MIKRVEFCEWDIFHFSNDRRCFKLYVISNFVDISVNLRKVDQWDNKNSLRILITWSTELLITVCRTQSCYEESDNLRVKWSKTR